jgi:hypothetical protein
MENSNPDDIKQTVTLWVKEIIEKRQNLEQLNINVQTNTPVEMIKFNGFIHGGESTVEKLTPQEIKEEIIRLGTQYPNNQELGREVRKLINFLM